MQGEVPALRIVPKTNQLIILAGTPRADGRVWHAVSRRGDFAVSAALPLLPAQGAAHHEGVGVPTRAVEMNAIVGKIFVVPLCLCRTNR